MTQLEDARLVAAHECRLSGQYTRAEPLYRQLTTEPALAPVAWWGLGLTLMNLGEFDDAIHCLNHAVQLQPDSQKFLLDLGKHQAMLGLFDDAKVSFEKVLEVCSTSREADEARGQLRYCD